MTNAVRTFLADRLDIEHRVAAKALEDPEFAAELRQDPRSALEAFLGCELPSALTVRIVEQGATEIVAAVPAPAEDALSEDELASAAGGLTGAMSGGGMFQDMMAQNMQMLALQQSIQSESRQYLMLSQALSAAHQSASNSVRRMK